MNATTRRMGVLLLGVVSPAALMAQTPTPVPTPTPMPAETPATADTEAATLETVHVQGERRSGYGSDVSRSAGKMPLPIMSTPQAVMVIPQQLLEDFQPLVIEEALRTVSGVSQDNTFGNTSDGLTIRGFNADGRFRNGIPALGARLLTPAVEQVEVLKGPSSLLYGAVEPGGLVNATIKRPVFDEAFTAVRVEGSTLGARLWQLDTSAPVRLGTPYGDVAYRLIVDRDNSDYWRNFGRYNDTFIAPSVSLRSERLSATLAYEYYDRIGPFDRGAVVVGDTIADVSPRQRMGEPFERLAERTNLLEADIAFDWRPTTTVQFKAAYQDSKGDDLQARPRRVTTDNEGNPVLVRRVDGSFGRFADATYLSTSVLQRLTVGGVGHQILLGVDHERGESGRAGFLQGPDEAVEDALDIFNPVYGTLDPAGAVPIADGATASDEETSGVYLQDVVTLGSRWTLVLGGRYETFDSVSDSDATLPRAGIVFQPQPWISLYASYSESFAPNSYNPADFAPGAPASVAPEEGVSNEVGIKLKRGELTLTTAAFRIRKQNVLQTINEFPVLIDQAESEGIEVDLIGDLTPSLSLSLGYAYLETDTGGGRKLRNVPRHTLGISGSYRIEEGALKGSAAGISAQYVGDRDGGPNPGASPGGPNFFIVPSYTVVDLFVAYEWQTVVTPLKFQLNLKNAFDEVYYPSSGGSLRVNPGQVRTLSATVSTRF